MFTGSPTFTGTPATIGKPSGDNQRQYHEDSSASFAKDASPAAFGSDRSPLSPLGTNSFGMRQRRQPKDTFSTSLVAAPSAVLARPAAFEPVVKGPPKFSLTISMGNEANMVSTDPLAGDVSNVDLLWKAVPCYQQC